MTELHTLTIHEAQTLIHQKKLSPLELVEACLRQIDSREATINAFITLAAEQAIAHAKAVHPAKIYARSPLQTGADCLRVGGFVLAM